MKAKIWNDFFWIDIVEPDKLKSLCNGILKDSGFNIIKIVEYYFTPYGYTCVFLLAESHLAVHTFPEEGKTYIELSSCVRDKFNVFVKLKNKYFIRGITWENEAAKKS